MLQAVKSGVRAVMRKVAARLHVIFKGKLSPNVVTITGVGMHLPIAFCIATGRPLVAAVLLIIFGLFDTLDGELARLQNRSSVRGMLLDASTDRMKEVMLYTGAAYAFAVGDHPATAAWAVAACGASLTVSYVKAKGEAAVSVSDKKIPHAVLNRLFSDGLLPFEMRMFVLIIGLLSGYLVWAVAIIAVLASYTALQRLVRISARV